MKTKQKLCMLVALLLILVLAAACNSGDDNDDVNTGEQYSDAGNIGDRVQDISNQDTSGNNEPGFMFEFSNGLDENGFFLGVTAVNHVEMFDYNAFAVPQDVYNVTDEAVSTIIAGRMREFAINEQIMDREVEHGDEINIDFVGSVDGEEFAGGSTFGMGMDVIIGETQFIDDFLYQLIGAMPGDVVNVEVTFPENYFEESLAGLDALFVTTVNYIVGDEIQPELTDEFMHENLFFRTGFSTVVEWEDNIREELREDAIVMYLHEFVTSAYVVTYVPESVLEYHRMLYLEHQSDTARQFGMTLEDLMEWFGYGSIEEFLGASHEEILQESRFSVAMQAIAEDAGIVVEYGDVVQYFAESFFIDNIDSLVELYGLPWLKQFVRTQRVIDLVVENVVVR